MVVTGDADGLDLGLAMAERRLDVELVAAVVCERWRVRGFCSRDNGRRRPVVRKINDGVQSGSTDGVQLDPTTGFGVHPPQLSHAAALPLLPTSSSSDHPRASLPLIASPPTLARRYQPRQPPAPRVARSSSSTKPKKKNSYEWATNRRAVQAVREPVRNGVRSD
nr:hypothetical protein Iba_chr15cCG6280 [Ipomoea batatas]